MKRILLIALTVVLLVTGCQLDANKQRREDVIRENRPSENATETAASLQQAVTGSIQQASQEPVEDPKEATAPQPPGSTGPTTLQIIPPEGWYFIQNRLDELLSVVYTNYDPNQIRLDESLTSIPSNFAIGAVAISPLPPDSDPAALQAGLESNVQSYNASDMEGMLVIADQIGIIDLTTVEEVLFISAQIEDLAGHQALRMDGIIDMGQTDNLQGQIWLTWTGTSFISLFEFAQLSHWSAVVDTFAQTRSTLQLP